MAKNKEHVWRKRYFDQSEVVKILEAQKKDLENELRREKYKVYTKEEELKLLRCFIQFQDKHIHDWQDKDFIESCHSV